MLVNVITFVAFGQVALLYTLKSALHCPGVGLGPGLGPGLGLGLGPGPTCVRPLILSARFALVSLPAGLNRYEKRILVICVDNYFHVHCNYCTSSVTEMTFPFAFVIITTIRSERPRYALRAQITACLATITERLGFNYFNHIVTTESDFGQGNTWHHITCQFLIPSPSLIQMADSAMAPGQALPAMAAGVKHKRARANIVIWITPRQILFWKFFKYCSGNGR